MSLRNKVVIVTGAGSGIGAATAIILAREGATVVLADKNEANLNSVTEKCSEISKQSLSITADVSKNDGAEKILNTTIEEFGKLDVLVNVAGVINICSVADENLADNFYKVINTNLRSVVVLTSLAAPHLIKTKGNIVNVCSILGSMVYHSNSLYCASKAGVKQFSRVAAAELGGKGVRVNTVSPGPVETAIYEAAGYKSPWNIMKPMTALNKTSQPEDIGELIAYIASDKANSITGSDFVIDCGAYIKK